MKKLLAVAFVTLAAFGLGVAPASAGLFHHHCDEVSAHATQYNAFSPYCVTGVYTHKHCHKCCYPAECACNNPGGGANCADGFCGRAAMAGGDSATLGILPAAPAMGTAQSGPFVVPKAPAPLPAIPGATSQLQAPPRMIQAPGY
jgi:hypothetical protein